MLSPTTFVIRPVEPLDIARLDRLAALDSAAPLPSRRIRAGLRIRRPAGASAH